MSLGTSLIWCAPSWKKPRPRIRPARSLRHLLRTNHEADRAVAARGHLVKAQRLHDRAGGEHFLEAQLFLELGDRIERGVAPVLDGDARQLRPSGAELVH